MTLPQLSAIRPARVLADAVPRTFVSDLLLVVGGAALTGLFAQIDWHVNGWPVPFTGQTLAVLLVAAALGRTRGALSMGLYGGAGIAGVPWLAGAAHGWPTYTFGYLVGFVAAGFLVGALAERGWTNSGWRTVAAMTLGTLVIYACGVPWLAQALGGSYSKAIAAGLTPFIVTDVLKVLAAAALLPDLIARISRRS
jgi:biotin transport system substrate-specific component